MIRVGFEILFFCVSLYWMVGIALAIYLDVKDGVAERISFADYLMVMVVVSVLWPGGLRFYKR